MGVKERLIQFIEYKKLSIKEFQKSIDVSVSYVTNISQSIGAVILRRIIEVYPDLNPDWLIKGEGDMIKKMEDSALNGKTILVLPTSAQGGRLTDFVTSIYAQDCERMVSPIDDADFAIPVTGDSMAPEYPNGSRVLIKKINEKAFIDWGRTFVLDTCNGTVIKNIYPGSTERCVKCVSINERFPEFEVQYSDVYGWYRVLALLALK